MILTKRDHELFIKVRSYGIMTTQQVASMHFPGMAMTTVLRRLRKLERANYVQRIKGLETNGCAWAITEKANLLVGERTFKRHFRRDVLDHDLKLTSLRLALEGNGFAWSWIPEHEIRSHVARRHGLRDIKNRTVADGIIGIRFKDISESVAVELELNFKNQGRYLNTLADYSSKSQLWAVWYLVHTPSLGRLLTKLWCRSRWPSSPVRFLWSVASEVISDPASAKIYGVDTETTIGKVWQKKPKEVAHIPALEVSNASVPVALSRIDGTPEKDEEKLAPAS